MDGIGNVNVKADHLMSHLSNVLLRYLMTMSNLSIFIELTNEISIFCQIADSSGAKVHLPDFHVFGFTTPLADLRSRFRKSE